METKTKAVLTDTEKLEASIRKMEAALGKAELHGFAQGSLERAVQLKQYRERLVLAKRELRRQRAGNELVLLSWADKKIMKWLDYRKEGKIADVSLGSGNAGRVGPSDLSTPVPFGGQSVDDVVGQSYGLGRDLDLKDWHDVEALIRQYTDAHPMLWGFRDLLEWVLLPCPVTGKSRQVGAFRMAMPYRDGYKQTLLSIGAPAVRSASEHVQAFRLHVARWIEKQIADASCKSARDAA